MGLSQELNVGDYRMVTVGNSFGVRPDRHLRHRRAPLQPHPGSGSKSYEDLPYRTDASINAGNSGGALINMAGQLMGHEHRHPRPQRRQCGRGLRHSRRRDRNRHPSSSSIPARFHTARSASRDAGPDTASRTRHGPFGEFQRAGVEEVDAEAPAASAAGLEPGDVIAGLTTDSPVTSGAYCATPSGRSRPGANVRLAVLRDGGNGSRIQRSSPLRSAGPADKPKKTEETPPLSSGLKIGLIAQSDPALRQAERRGRCRSVEPGRSHCECGHPRGRTFIVSVDRKPVETPEDYARLERAHAPDRPMLIEFRRGDLNLFSAIEQ